MIVHCDLEVHFGRFTVQKIRFTRNGDCIELFIVTFALKENNQTIFFNHETHMPNSTMHGIGATTDAQAPLIPAYPAITETI